MVKYKMNWSSYVGIEGDYGEGPGKEAEECFFWHTARMSAPRFSVTKVTDISLSRLEYNARKSIGQENLSLSSLEKTTADDNIKPGNCLEKLKTTLNE